MSTHPLLYYRAVLSPWGTRHRALYTRLACTAPSAVRQQLLPSVPLHSRFLKYKGQLRTVRTQPAALETVCSCPSPGAILGLSILAAVSPGLVSVPGLMPVLPIAPVRSSKWMWD